MPTFRICPRKPGGLGRFFARKRGSDLQLKNRPVCLFSMPLSRIFFVVENRGTVRFFAP